MLDLVFDEVQDPKQTEHWNRFATTNPILAREVIKRCYIELRSLDITEKQLELQHIAKQLAIYTVAALERAASRVENSSPPNDGGGDAVLIP